MSKLRALLLALFAAVMGLGGVAAATVPASAYVSTVRQWCSSEQSKPYAYLVLASGSNGTTERGKPGRVIIRNCYQYYDWKDVNSFWIPYGMKARVNYHSIGGTKYTINPPGKGGAWHNVSLSKTTRTYDVHLVPENY